MFLSERKNTMEKLCPTEFKCLIIFVIITLLQWYSYKPPFCWQELVKQPQSPKFSHSDPQVQTNGKSLCRHPSRWRSCSPSAACTHWPTVTTTDWAPTAGWPIQPWKNLTPSQRSSSVTLWPCASATCLTLTLRKSWRRTQRSDRKTLCDPNDPGGKLWLFRLVFTFLASPASFL